MLVPDVPATACIFRKLQRIVERPSAPRTTGCQQRLRCSETPHTHYYSGTATQPLFASSPNLRSQSIKPAGPSSAPLKRHWALDAATTLFVATVFHTCELSLPPIPLLRQLELWTPKNRKSFSTECYFVQNHSMFYLNPLNPIFRCSFTLTH